MLYIGKNIKKMYEDVEGIIDKSKDIVIYSFRDDSYKIYFDDEKKYDEIKNLQEKYNCTYLFQFLPLEINGIQKFYELSIENLKEIFFKIIPENKYGIYFLGYNDNNFEEIYGYIYQKCEEELQEVNSELQNFNIEKYESPSSFIEEIYAEQEKRKYNNFLDRKDSCTVLKELIKDKESIKLFLKIFSFISQPLDKITKNKIEEIFNTNLKPNLLNIQIEKDKDFSSDFITKFILKFQLLLIIFYEKIYFYSQINPSFNINEISKNNLFLNKKILPQIVDTNQKVDLSFNAIYRNFSKFFSNFKFEIEDIKSFCYNDFNRLYLYYKNNFLFCLKKISQEELNKVFGKNTHKVLSGEREISSDKLNEIKCSIEEKEILNKSYYLMKKFESLHYLIKNEDIDKKNIFFYDFFEKNKFQIEVELDRRGIRILEKTLYSYSYYSEKIDNLTKLMRTYYVVKKCGEIKILKFINYKEGILYFFNENEEVVYFNEKEIEIHDIDTLTFLENREVESTKKLIKLF